MANERTSKTDRGVSALVKDTLKHVFGLSDKSADEFMKVVRNNAEMATMKNHVRDLSGIVHKRMNNAIDDALKSGEKVEEEPTEDTDKKAEKEAEPKMEEPKKEEPKKDEPKEEPKEEKKAEEVKESALPHTFLQFLNELDGEKQMGSTIQDMDQQELMRVAKMSPERKERELIRRKRMAKQKEKNPRVRQLLKKREMIDKELAKARAQEGRMK